MANFTVQRTGKELVGITLPQVKKVLFDGKDFDDLVVHGYEFSADENLILIKTDVEQLWRRSTKENYYLYNLKKNFAKTNKK